MGAYLSTPNTEKHSTDNNNELMHCGSSQMQGWRTSQEVTKQKHYQNGNIKFVQCGY